MTTETALVACDNERIIEALATPSAMDLLLAEVRSKVDEFKGDATTAKGRADIKSFAFKLVKTRTTIDGIGKDQVADITAKIKAYNAQRKACREALEEMQAEVRAPLDEWERVREEAEAKISGVLTMPQSLADTGPTTDDIRLAIAKAKEIDASDIIEERQDDYCSAIEKTISRLSDMLAESEQRDRDAAELARLREEAAKREAEEERKRIEQAAAEKARAEAQAEAARAAEQAEAEAKRRIEQAEREKREAVEREERARLEAEAAVERERKRIEAEKEAERIAEEKKLADKKHIKAIRDEIKRNIFDAIATSETAPDDIADAIMAGDIPHVKVIL